MQKNWYAVYTKPYCEKKVARVLNRKGIEIFLPLNSKKSSLWGNRQQEPLFKSFIFLRATEDEVINLSKKIDGVLSALYWLGKPAAINETDINAIREFTNSHKEIMLEKRDVNLKSYDGIIDDIFLSMDGKTLTIKKRAIRVNLPSLGFTMVAKMEGEDIAGREIFPGRKDLVAHQ